jgi:hypothetical protein
MRQICVLAGSVILLLMAPTPAHAWWEFLEEFSGPKTFWGWDVELRLFCVVDTRTTTITREINSVTNEVTKETKETKTTGTERNTQKGIGIILNTCKRPVHVEETPDKKTKTIERQTLRLAFDVGARFLWSDHNERDFAGGERISLTTLEPAVTIPLWTTKAGRDILHYGFGAGVYWMSSKGFPSFNGAFLEPVRVDIHIPTRSTRVPAIVLRASVLNFPAGFEPEAFAPTSDRGRISRDWVLNAGIFAEVARW